MKDLLNNWLFHQGDEWITIHDMTCTQYRLSNNSMEILLWG